MRTASLLVFCFAVAGCGSFPEACFDLSPTSRLPKWFSLPAGTARQNATVHMCYFVKETGRTASLVLRASDQKLAEVQGILKGLEPLTLKQPAAGFPPGYPSYEIVTVGGVTDVIEHRRMEPIFYVTDDPAVWSQLGASE